MRHCLVALETAAARSEDWFRSRLENLVDGRHPRIRLAQRMPWAALEDALQDTLPPAPVAGGRPALPVRLMAGLLYLKHAYDLSDEAVCERWLENPYWPCFTGDRIKPQTALVDLGFRGREIEGTTVLHRGKAKRLTRSQWRWVKRRQAIEPIIGHVKDDCGMRRGALKGAQGDAFHALLCAAGDNFRWLLR